MRNHDHQHNADPWNRDFYGTGSTRPPKQQGGLIAFLLVLILLMGGLCSALGIINVQLLAQLAQVSATPETLPLFGIDDGDNTDIRDTTDIATLSGQPLPRLDAHGQTVTEFERHFYELPYGVLVTDVLQDRMADRAGLRSGDIIVSLGGQIVTSREELLQVLEQWQPGETVVVEYYRQQNHQQGTTHITLSNEE